MSICILADAADIDRAKQTVLYTPPPSPSGLRGQSEDSPSSPRTVLGVRRKSEQSEDSPSEVRVLLLKQYFYSARTLLGLC
jgi:hypothetical protein